MRESQCADHAVIETRMTHTANESSSGIYTLGDEQERDNQEKREEVRNSQLDFPLSTENSLLQIKICIL